MNSDHWKIQGKRLQHSGKCIKGYSEKESKLLIGMTRKELRIVISIKTGHGCLNKFLFIIGKAVNKNCRFCNSNDETFAHLLTECTKLTDLRIKHLGETTPKLEYFTNHKYKDLIKFANKTGISDTIEKIKTSNKKNQKKN